MIGIAIIKSEIAARIHIYRKVVFRIGPFRQVHGHLSLQM